MTRACSMDPIREIRERLAANPDVRLEGRGSFIEIIPTDPSGFSIALLHEGFQFTVTYCGGWHEHFVSAEDALNCVGFGLSEECRLKVVMAGSFEFRWTVEYINQGEWVEDSTTGLFFYPYWRTRNVVYRHNRIRSKKSNG